MSDQGGDAACWLHRVCPECGLFAVDDPPTRCERCGGPVGGEDAESGPGALPGEAG